MSMSDETRFKSEEVKENAIKVTKECTSVAFEIVSDHELSHPNMEGHVLAIYNSMDIKNPVALTPYFDDLRTYNVMMFFEIPVTGSYFIVDITDYTGSDAPPPAEEDSKDRFQGILGEQSTKEAIKDKVKKDIVSNPSHYTYANIEIIDIVEQITSQYPSDVAFAIGNVVKYVSRAPHKNQSEDLNKAMWYLQRAIEKYDEE